MPLTSNQKSDFISRLRAHAASEVALRNQAVALKREYDALDLGNVIVDGDFVGANEGLTKANMVSVITSITNLETTWDSGNDTNMNTFKS